MLKLAPDPSDSYDGRSKINKDSSRCGKVIDQVVVVVYVLKLLSTVSFTELDQGSEMIIFKSTLTTFNVSSIFEAAVKNGLSLKSNQHRQI
jgi:hypothetical protein